MYISTVLATKDDIREGKEYDCLFHVERVYVRIEIVRVAKKNSAPSMRTPSRHNSRGDTKI